MYIIKSFSTVLHQIVLLLLLLLKLNLQMDRKQCLMLQLVPVHQLEVMMSNPFQARNEKLNQNQFVKSSLTNCLK